MFRKMLLALTIAVLPVAGAHALGLGGVTLQSRLNEPLDAEIELRSVQPGDLEKLRVGLASSAEFEQAGLDRPFLLASLQFKTVQRGDKTFVKVTTRDPFREPFLSFLLKVEWPNGRLLREYTLLLDPPVLTREAAPAVQAPAAQAAPQLAPAAPGTAPSTPMRSAPTPRAAPAPRVSSMGGDEYRVNRGDNLYTIARETLVGGGVSSQQAMLAFLRANPEAFINNNINLLKEGYVLRIPTADEALTVTQAEAIAEVRRQMAEWRTYRQARAATPVESAGAVAAAPQPRLEVVAPEKGEGAAAPGETAGDQGVSPEIENIQRELALATEAAETRRLENEELRGQVADLEEKLEEMQRLVTVKVEELAALQARLKEAEAAAAGGAPEAVEPTEQEAPTPSAASEAEQPAAEAPATESAAEEGPAESAAEPAVETPAETTTAEATPSAATEQPAPQPQPAPSVREPVPATSFQPPAPEPGPLGFLEDLLGPGFMEDPVMLGGIGGGILLLILLLIMALRRRGGGAEEAAEPVPELAAAGVEEAVTEVPEEGESFLDTAADMQVADFEEPAEAEEPAQAAGVDQVIAEADVYLAYGRYQQAEELIKGAIDENPDRVDLKSKLLEVYFATRDREAFEPLAQELHSTIEAAGGAEWDKYMLMGKDLCPDNPLFASAAAASATEERGVPSGALDTGIQFDPFAESASASGSASGEPELAEDLSQALEFDLGEEAAEAPEEPTDTVVEPQGEAPKEETAEAGEEEALDFDFDFGESQPEEELDLEGTLPLGTEIGEAESEPAVESGADFSLETTAELEEEPSQAEDLTLDFDIGGAESEQAETGEEEFDLALHTIQTEAEAIEKEMQEEGLGEEPAPAESEETGEASAEASMVGEASSMLDERDFSIEWDITGMGEEDSEQESASTEEAGEELSRDDLENTAILDFTSVPLDEESGSEDADMVATKLDLARAYIDMGDSDGARNILDEVVKEGNDSQRQEAEQLLNQL
ncbi:MAG: hypothetical protein Kow006_01990 [Gammaproteobacteria bacterium]